MKNFTSPTFLWRFWNKANSLFFTAALLSLISWNLEGQVSSYSFAQTSGSYTEITGGTVLGTPTSDDQRFVDPAVPAGGTTTTGPGFDIGFNFTYNGNVFNRIAINTNGWVSLGNSSFSPGVDNNTSSAYTPLSSTAANTPTFFRSRVAGMARDLQGNGTDSEMRIETIGTAPNRVCVIQWKNFKRFGTTGTGDILNYQIRLNENGNTVQTVYGANTFGATSSTNIHVGLGGTTAPDFNNRKTTTDWNATTAGATNAEGCTIATAVTVPASGLTFTWTPPPPPALDMGATALASPPLGCYGSSEAVSVTIKNFGTDPINFATNNTTVNCEVTGAGTQSFNVTLTTGTLAAGATQNVAMGTLDMTVVGTYTFNANTTVTGDGNPTNNAMPATTRVTQASTALPNNVNFTGFTGANLGTLFPGWREALGVAPPTGTTSAWTSSTAIPAGGTTARVNLVGTTRNEWIISPTFTPTSSTVLDFKAAITDLSSGNPDPEGMQGTDDKVRVMVSTNCGGTWTPITTFDASNTTGLTNVLTQYTFSLSSYAGMTTQIAFYATDGPVDDAPSYDFHIDDIFIGAPPALDMGATALASPATTGCFGSAESVTVTIKNFGTDPINFATNNTTVNCEVTGAGTQSFNVTLTTGTLAAGATQNVAMGTLDMSVSGTYTFNANTTVTGDGNPTNNAMPATTRFTAASTSLPNSVDFTGFTGSNLATVFPGWREAAGTAPAGTTSIWTSSTVFTGNTTAKINLYLATRNEWIISPTFSPTATTQLDFKAAITDFASGNPDPSGMQGTDDKVRVMVSTNCGGTWTPIFTFDASNTTGLTNVLTPYSVSLGAYAGMTTQIAFYATDGPVDDAPDYDFHIDDIFIGTIPCPNPSGLAVTNITGTGADLSWTPGAGCSGMEYWVLPSPSTAPTAGTGTDPTCSPSFPISVSGLTILTGYDVWVYKDCGADGTAGPVNLGSFTTGCAGQSCAYTFSLEDTFGDGWNGGQMQVVQNGTVLATLSGPATFGPLDVPVNLCDGLGFDLVWSACGSYPEEIIVNVLDSDGINIFSSGPAAPCTAGTTKFTTTATCPVPPLCSITAIAASNLSACTDNGTSTPADDTFTGDVTVTFENAPATGTLDLTGDGAASVDVSLLDSPTSHTFIGVTMIADGTDIALTAAFSADGACTFTENNAGTAPASCSCGLIINEVDYDQPGGDDAEFIELYNPCTYAVDLAGYTLELVNGSNGLVYETITLNAGSVAAGGYYVICTGGNSAAYCDQTYSGSTQNGAPDAMGLRLNGTLVDAVSYEGSVPGYTEGSGDGLEDPSGAGDDLRSISRFPNGVDTDMNNVDFSTRCATPGAANSSSASATTFYADTDMDGFGDPNSSVIACDQPTGFVANSGDCNDGNAAINPNATEVCDGIDNNCDGNTDEGLTFQDYYLDGDGDGFGAGSPTNACQSPGSNYVLVAGDCNDSNAAINPNATEVCDGIDNNCDGNTDEGLTFQDYYLDADGDGFGAGSPTNACQSPGSNYVLVAGDCNDSNAAINPNATEVCDGVDNDCDGETDEAPATPTTYYQDADGDGFGNAAVSQESCAPPTGYVLNSLDCNDGNAAINPNATEVCDGVDNDCDGMIDEGVLLTFYQDFDGDGFGNAAVTQQACSAPTGYVANSLDCNDTNGAVNPNADEVCDGIDNDCDGTTDVNPVSGPTWYADTDGDGFGNAASSVIACSQPTGFVSNSLDCNDSNAAINPNAAEVCDGVDNDCDGETDEFATDAPTWYADADGDGFGNVNVILVQCGQPTGYVSNSNDCNDADANINPNTVWYVDFDGDGFGNPASSVTTCDPGTGYVLNGGDCNDNVAAINPNATEICDGIDNDCDGLTDEGVKTTFYQDSDGDGFGNAAVSQQACSAPTGFVTNSTDCNDNNAAVNPGATEVCNGIDDNCDGNIDEGVTTTYYADTDGDGFGDPNNTTEACSLPTGFVTNNGDCDDTNANVNPDALEICGNAVDDNCNGEVDEDCDCTVVSLTVTNISGCNDNGTDDPFDDTFTADVTIVFSSTPTTGSLNLTGDGTASIAVTGLTGTSHTFTGVTMSADATAIQLTASFSADPACTLTNNNAGVAPASCSGTCVVAITNIAVTNETCPSYGNGSITISATGSGQLGYSINGGTSFQFTNVFNNVSPGTYNIVVRVFGTPTCDATGTATVLASDPANLKTWYQDWDNDGYSNGTTQQSCTQPTGYKLLTDLTAAPTGNNIDCNDYSAAQRPGQIWWKDADNDGWATGPSVTQCTRPTGYKTAAELNNNTSGDCNDANAAINPGATELCDGIDNDCDGLIDEDGGGGQTWVGNLLFSNQAQVDAFSQCYSVIQGNLTIQNSGVNNLANLIYLEQVTGYVKIQSTSLTSMAGLDNLTTIGGNFEVKSNNSLTTLNGLEGVTTVGGSLKVWFNNILSDCCAIYDLLNGQNGKSVTGAKTIFRNDSGCDSETDINADCAPTDDFGAPTAGSPAVTFGQSAPVQRMEVYPNPLSGNVLTISFAKPFEAGQLELFDLQGRLVKSIEIGGGISQYHLAANDLRPSVYLLHVTVDGESFTERLIVN